MRTAPGGRRDILPQDRADIDPADRAWFDRTARAAACRACEGRFAHRADEAESFAREAGWLAYARGGSRAYVARAMGNGAKNFLILHRGVTEAGGGGRRTLGSHDRVNEPLGLTFTGRDGAEVWRREPGAWDEYFAGEALRALLASLGNARLRRVLELRYVEQLSQTEAARAVGVSQPRLCLLERDALRRLRASPEAQAWLSP